MRSWHISKMLIILMVLTATVNFPVHAEIMSQWAPDQRVPGYLDDTFTPYLLADQNRTVHAFASQWVDDGDRRLAIIYRKWSLAGGWTRPVDILLAPSRDAHFLSAFLDVFGTIHLLFSNDTGTTNVIYYSNAPAVGADSALAWSAPQIIGGGIFDFNSGALSGDNQGNLVFIYSGNSDGNGVYALRSSDSGQTWSDPLPVYQTQDATLVPFSLRLFAGPNQQIRAAWNVVSSTGVDEFLYFSNYDIPSGKWSKPSQLDERIDLPEYFGPSYPAIVDNGREIVILYNSGNPFAEQPVARGRPVPRSIISVDGGKTWSDPSNPFPLLLGRSGEHTMVMDGMGNLHTLVIQRIDRIIEGVYKPIGGIWHSTFQNGVWSNPERFTTAFAVSNVRAVVVQGNVLLAVWIEDQGVGQNGVWYSYTKLDVPEAPVVALSTLVAPVPSVVESATPVITSPTSTPELIPVDSQTKSNLGSPLVMGILPVVILLILVMLFYNSNQNVRGK